MFNTKVFQPKLHDWPNLICLEATIFKLAVFLKSSPNSNVARLLTDITEPAPMLHFPLKITTPP